MKVGQFGEAFPPIKDGVAQVVKNYAYWLSEKNEDSYVITANVPNVEDKYKFEVLRYKSFGILLKKDYRTGFPKLDRKFYNELKKIKFDIVHSHSPFSAGKLGLSLAEERNIPSVITFHTKFKTDFKQVVKSDFIAEMMLRKIMPQYDRADDVWTVSEAAVETLREYGYKGDVFIAENACDFEPEQKSQKSLDMIDKMYKIPKGMPVFAFVGQLIFQKNTKLVADALSIVNKDGYDFRMFYVGEGDKKNELQRIVKSYGLENKITFTGNISNRIILKNIYQRSHAILFPSLYDVSSLVIKEASSMSCPMVMVKGSTTAQGVIDLENGFLVENSAESLAKKIEMILDNKALAEKAGQNAYKTLYRSWEQSVEKARQRYMYLIDRNK